MTRGEAGDRLRRLLADGALDLPLPGAGSTAARFRRLLGLAAAEDLSVARLAEAHCDAGAIVGEAGRSLEPGVLAAVWASRYGGAQVRAERTAAGWRLTGTLGFCSGAPIVDVALVDATLVGASADDPLQLFLVPLDRGGVHIDTSRWATAALAATGTGRVELDVEMDGSAAIGPPGYYLDRAGFWHGAIGVAACWAGGAHGIHASTVGHVERRSPHVLANVGRSAAACWAMAAIVDRAANDIDRRPSAVDMAAALTVRHLVANWCGDVTAASRRATGPGPLAFDAAHAQRIADLELYIEQQHHEADLAEIGRGALER